MAKTKRPNPQTSAAPLEQVTLALVKWGVFLTFFVISPAGREGIRFEFLKTADEALRLALEPDAPSGYSPAERLAARPLY